MSFDEVSAGAVVFYRGDALEYLMLTRGISSQIYKDL
jgi:hypothetical protein